MKVSKVIGILLCSTLISFGVTPAQTVATTCPPSKSDGPTIGKVQVGDVAVNIKKITYPKGGVLNPPRSALNAGLSARHMPLSAKLGTSVITWHVNFNGCVGKLNLLSKKAIGFEFSVIDENGESVTYSITEKKTVKKGNYKAEWFDLSGPRQLLLVTCTGAVVNGSYQKNLILTAEPVA